MKYSDNPFNHGRTARTLNRNTPLYVAEDTPTPGAMMWLGGIVAGVVFAVLLWLAV